MYASFNQLMKVLCMIVVFQKATTGSDSNPVCPMKESNSSRLLYNCSGIPLPSNLCHYFTLIAIDFRETGNVNITVSWTNLFKYNTVHTIQFHVCCTCDEESDTCVTPPAQSCSLHTPLMCNYKLQRVPRAKEYTLRLHYNVSAVTVPSLPCSQNEFVSISTDWTPSISTPSTSTDWTPSISTDWTSQQQSEELSVAIIIIPILLAAAAASMLAIYLVKRSKRLRRYTVSPSPHTVESVDVTVLTTADELNFQVHTSTDIAHHQSSYGSNLHSSLHASPALPLTAISEPIQQIYISHPAKSEESEMKLADMMAKFHMEGIACKAAFTNRVVTAERGYSAISAMMKAASYILICCDEEMLAEMERLTQDNQSEETSPFQPFKREASLIDVEHSANDFKRLVVVLLEGAKLHCVPEIFRGTTVYKYPENFEDILARLQRVEHHQLPPLSRRPSSPLEERSSLADTPLL